MTVDSFVIELQATAGDSVFDVIEQHIELAVQDKPRWLPQSLWDRILRRVLRVEVS